jgi:uncharacterized Zn-finger protein
MPAKTQGKPSKYNKSKPSHANLTCPHVDCKENILTFSTPKDLKKHTKKVHSPPKINKCGFQGCGEIFPKKSELKTHAATHRKKHICTVVECSVEMPSRKAWRNHLKLKHPDSVEGKILVQEEEDKRSARAERANPEHKVLQSHTNLIQGLISQIKKLELRVKILESK